jgi:hypothetical protein
MLRSLLAVILGAVLVSSSALAQVGASSGAISSSASPPSPSLGPGQGTTPVGTSGGHIRDIGAGRGVLSPGLRQNRPLMPPRSATPSSRALGVAFGARGSDTGAGTFGNATLGASRRRSHARVCTIETRQVQTRAGLRWQRARVCPPR